MLIQFESLMFVKQQYPPQRDEYLTLYYVVENK